MAAANTKLLGPAMAKTVIGATVGVMLAGFLMYQFRDIGFIQTARNGFDT